MNWRPGVGRTATTTRRASPRAKGATQRGLVVRTNVRMGKDLRLKTPVRA